jgi:hypothetical protein
VLTAQPHNAMLRCVVQLLACCVAGEALRERTHTHRRAIDRRAIWWRAPMEGKDWLEHWDEGCAKGGWLARRPG